MNILFLYWGKRGGGARYSLELTRALAELPGVQINLSVSNQCEILSEFKALGLPTHYVDTYQNVFGFLKKFTLDRARLQKNLEDYLRKYKVRYVIIGMDFFWGPLIFQACKNAGARALYVVHEPKPHPKEPMIMGAVKRITLKKGITGADHVITLTHHVKKYIHISFKVSEEEISVIPHGIFSYVKAVSPKELPAADDPLTLLYFGRIEYYKGLDILLDAFQLIKNKRHNVRLEIWGSGDLNPYKEQIEGTGSVRIENRWVDEEEIAPLFRRADLCILPYRDASQSGVVGISSDAAVPIVATPAEGLIEQLQNSGALFSQNFTAESLAESVSQLLDDPERYQELSARSLQYAKDLRWTNIAGKFIEVCKKLE